MRHNEIVLLYHIEDEEKAKRLKRVLLLMGVKIRMVSPEQYHLPIKDLINGQSGEITKEETANLMDCVKIQDTDGAENEKESIQEEMMVMYGFSGNRLDELLNALRKNQARINLKAILTETNKEWSSYVLYQELKKEHEMMQKQNG